MRSGDPRWLGNLVRLLKRHQRRRIRGRRTERAGNSDNLGLLLLTERKSMKQVLEYVVQGNTTQMDDPAFVAELKAWIRFNGRDSARTRDGLYSAWSGSPSIQL